MSTQEPSHPPGKATKAFRIKPEPMAGEGGLGEQPIKDGSSSDDLPRSYGQETVFLIAQEPHWLFTYWEIPISRHPGGPCHLRVFREGFGIETEIEVPFETRNWYIPVREGGATYSVEVGFYRGDQWHSIAKSSPATTPSDKMSELGDFQLATIPLHMSFQQLLKDLQRALEGGLPLSEAIARIQKLGSFFADLARDGGKWGMAESKILEALFGASFMEELASLNPAEIPRKIHLALHEKLSSPGASEFLSSFQGVAGESSLFSALSWLAGASERFAMGSESVAVPSSWAALSSWRAEIPSSLGAMSSWGEVSSWSAAALSSWVVSALSSWVLAAQAVASWGAQSSEILAQLSSWSQAEVSSWSREQLAKLPEQISSFLRAVQSSWLLAAESSWTVAALSSWSSAAAFSSWAEKAGVTSWGAASESLTSPMGAARQFFMHVNAEVIFYGGTDPKAKVTIDGKEVALSPDGTFRYHFVFPDGRYEIPIVAVSPDGVETRSAILRFERATTKVGQVDDTPQPPLGAPMGRKS